jgi:hypothetical protein
VLQRDYILRMIEQAAQALARATGLLAQHKLEDAGRELDGAYAALGVDRELLGVLDAATLAGQLRDDERVAAAARVLLCDAALCAKRGEHGAARRKLRVARNLGAQLAAPDATLEHELARMAGELDASSPRFS